MSGIIFHTQARDLRFLNERLKNDAIDLSSAHQELSDSYQLIRGLQSEDESPDYYRSFNRLISAFAETKTAYHSKKIAAVVEDDLKEIQTAREALQNGNFLHSNELGSKIKKDLSELPESYDYDIRDIGVSRELPEESRASLEGLRRTWAEFLESQSALRDRSEPSQTLKYKSVQGRICAK